MDEDRERYEKQKVSGLANAVGQDIERERPGIRASHLDNWFVHHPPYGDQAMRYTALRNAGKAFAQAILDLTPPCADQSSAIRKVREAVMTANAAIACDGR